MSDNMWNTLSTNILKAIVQETNKLLSNFIPESLLELEYSIDEKKQNAVETLPTKTNNADIEASKYRVKHCNLYVKGDSNKTPVGFFVSNSHMLKKVDNNVNKFYTTTHKTIVLETVPSLEKNTTIVGDYGYYSDSFIPEILPINYDGHTNSKSLIKKIVNVSLDKINNNIGTITIRYKDDLRKL